MEKFHGISIKMKPEDIRKYLDKWEPIMIQYLEPAYGSDLIKRSVPGWKCKTCGAQYGCVMPPGECWECPIK